MCRMLRHHIYEYAMLAADDVAAEALLNIVEVSRAHMAVMSFIEYFMRPSVRGESHGKPPEICHWHKGT